MAARSSAGSIENWGNAAPETSWRRPPADRSRQQARTSRPSGVCRTSSASMENGMPRSVNSRTNSSRWPCCREDCKVVHGAGLLLVSCFLLDLASESAASNFLVSPGDDFRPAARLSVRPGQCLTSRSTRGRTLIRNSTSLCETLADVVYDPKAHRRIAKATAGSFRVPRAGSQENDSRTK